MGKVVKLYAEQEKKQSLFELIIFGKPYEFNFFGKTIGMIGTFYQLRKQKEFYDKYWGYFVEGLRDIDPNLEFNVSHVTHRFNSLSELERVAIAFKCSKIYAFENKLTYSNFIDIVNSYVSKETIKAEPDFSGFNDSA
ncbi:MAG: hypothetical protein ACP5N2_03480 [Candidatus Nanoarchaeia archaeon]